MWRTALWGLGLGAGLGAAYGALAAPSGILVAALLDQARGLTELNAAGMLSAMAFGVPLGMIVGLALGAVAGVGLGIVCGALLFGATRAFFFQATGSPRYSSVAGLACAVATGLALLAAWAATGFRPDAPVGAGPTGTIDGGAADVAFWVVGPVLIAAWAARLAGRRVAGQWAGKARTGEDERRGIGNGATEGWPWR
jgi:hypothetical protein